MSEKLTGKFNVFRYRYRDAANFKATGEVLLRGELSEQNKQEIIGRLQDGEYFIAEQVRIPVLYDKLYEFSGGPVIDDHCWHEFIMFQTVSSPSIKSEVWGSAEAFLLNFRLVKHWDLAFSPHLAF